MIVTSQPLTLRYFISDIAGALLTFDRIRWYRSRPGADGLFEAATDVVPYAATMTAAKIEPHAVNGKTLSLRVNDSVTYDITFASVDPASTTDVIGEINGVASATLTATDDGEGRVKLTTIATGSGASIEVLEDSDAAPYLGFEVGDAAIGLDSDTTMVSGTHEYFFTDQNSDYDFWYRVQLRNSSTPDVSELSVAFPASQVQAVPVSQTIVGFVRLASMTGRPDVNRRITFFNLTLPNKSSDGTYGVMALSEQIQTDSAGYAEIRLLRGITIDVNIEGGFTRRITVPTTGDAFDLLDPSLVTTDEFGIQEPNIPFAVRTT